MKKINKNLTSFSDHLDKQYGKKGTAARNKYEKEFEAFKLKVLLQEIINEKNQPGDIWKSLSEDQKNEVRLAYKESENENNLKDFDELFK
jgi:hypothetical protein